MSWVLLTLLAVNLWAISNIMEKLAGSLVKNAASAAAIVNSVLLVYSSIIISFGVVKIPEPSYIAASILVGFSFFAGYVMFFKAIQSEEVSRVIPLYGLSTIFTLVLATIFLGEIFTLDKYVGIALLIAGSFLISFKKDKGKHRMSKAMVYMTLASMFYAASYIVIKYLSLYVDYLSVFAFSQLGMSSIAVLYLAGRRAEIKKIYSKNKRVFLMLAGAGTLAFLGFLAFLAAIYQGPVSLVNALDNTQNLFVLFYATIISIFKPSILKEEVKGSVIALKLLAIAVIFAGAYLVSM